MKRVQLSDGIGDCGLSDGLLLTEDMHKLLAENLEIKLNDISLPILNSIHGGFFRFWIWSEFCHFRSFLGYFGMF